MKLSKKQKKRLIRATFLIPFFTCLFTIVGIKSFVDYDLPSLTCNAGTARTVFLVIAAVLFVNVISSFASLIAYYCLENRVDDIISKREKDGKKD